MEGSMSQLQEDFVQSVGGSTVAGYYNAGAGCESTLHDNTSAFRRYLLKPALLPEGAAEDADVDVSTSLLGQRVSCPIGIAPTGFQRFLWTDGEVSSAKAAANQNVCYIMSLLSQSSMKDVNEASGGSVKWKNIYPFTEEGRDIAVTMMRNAEKHGVSAFVTTVDSPVFGWKINPEWSIDLYSLDIPDVTEACKQVGLNPAVTGAHAIPEYFITTIFTWADFENLMKQTRLPIIAKGILTAEDATLAISHGASAVYVSNHGGRQLDGSLATLHALSEVRAAVGDRVQVYLDGGVRSGVDVFKALALGADAVFLGRPALWGLGVSGQDGVDDVIVRTRRELLEAMKYTGCMSLKDINSSKLMLNQNCKL